MTYIEEIEVREDSPKNQLLQDLVVAFARADVSRISELVAHDVRWLPVGRQPVMGVDEFCRAITRYGPATRLTIERVISNQRAGAVNGVVEFGHKQRAFCYVFEFGTAPAVEVRTITSYSIALE